MLLFLVGYMGCGKTSTGRRLARRLGVRFADTDAEVERREGASVSDIFGYAGEEYFRRAERAVLEQIVASGEDAVVSTGGGLPVWGDNMDYMNSVGMTVYIRRSAQRIAARLTPYGRMKRPKLRGLGDGELVEFMTRDMVARAPFYERSMLSIDGDAMSDSAIEDTIIQRLENHE